MSGRVKRFWDDLWFASQSRFSYTAVRTILCLDSLWLLLSRPGLWRFAEWPALFRQPKYAQVLLRFGIFAPPAVERVLYLLLFVALLAALAGLLPRMCCFVAGILLYHFAIFEEVLIGVQLNGATGFTVPVIGLLVLSFVPERGKGPSSDYRWPVTLIQFVFALTYLLGGLSKIRFTGIQWYREENVADTMRLMATLTDAPWALATASHPVLVSAISIATLGLELLFPLAVVSRRARWILVPAAFVAHWLRTRIYGFYFMSWPLLLLFVNWEWLYNRVRNARTVDSVPAAS